MTGSLFLLALAVIFLPMLFDGAGLPEVQIEPLPDAVVLADAPRVPPPAPADIAAADELVPLVEALAEAVDEGGFSSATQTRLGEPVLSEVNADTAAWAVQVASFADLENARVFRARLREDGYEAFLSTIRTGNETRTRVAVGPLQNRQEAASLQAELSARYRVTARLMGFSS
ncbi:MAG: SPOR domain-containing protein [Pseudomonadales bacterium]|nr:SPOR domain-containing protein [Pseudomonadales bacterium]